MFDYDKVIKKLGKFDELPDKKKKKVMERVFIEDEFREWFYGVGENANAQPMTPQMVEKLLENLSRPNQLKFLIPFIDETDYDRFDHTSRTLAFAVAEHAVGVANKINAETKEKYESREISPKEVSKRNETVNEYMDRIGKLMEKIKDKAGHEVKDMAKKSNLPKGLVFTCYFLVPGRKFIPRRKVTFYMNQMLKEIYTYAGNNGMENVSLIRWGNLFGPLFGNEATCSAAVAVLLEGVKRIEQYKDLENFDDVKSVWNSLTNFALSELNNAPENTRRQMLELYIKKVDRIYHNGNGPRLRVNLLSLPREFSNLADTVTRYSDRLGTIMRNNLKPVADFKNKYADKPRQEDRRDNRHEDRKDERRDNQKEKRRDESDPLAAYEEVLNTVSESDDDPVVFEITPFPKGEMTDPNSMFKQLFESKGKEEPRPSKKDRDQNSKWAINLRSPKENADPDDDNLIRGIKNEPLLENDADPFLEALDADEDDGRLPIPPSLDNEDD